MKPVVPKRVALKRQWCEDQIRLYSQLRWQYGQHNNESNSVIEADIATYTAAKRDAQRTWEELFYGH